MWLVTSWLVNDEVEIINWNIYQNKPERQYWQLGRVVMAQVSGFIYPTCSKERGFESLSCHLSFLAFDCIGLIKQEAVDEKRSHRLSITKVEGYKLTALGFDVSPSLKLHVVLDPF